MKSIKVVKNVTYKKTLKYPVPTGKRVFKYGPNSVPKNNSIPKVDRDSNILSSCNMMLCSNSGYLTVDFQIKNNKAVYFIF